MRVLFSVVCAAALAGLAGCGGGGGGGDGGGAGTPVAPALTTTVRINGSAAVADASGRFATKPGDTVEITPSEGAQWSSAGASTITLLNPSTTATQWSAQILNPSTNAGIYTVSATTTASPARTKATVLNVAASTDANDGSYRVYASNGLQYRLSLDFKLNRYTFVNPDGSARVSDTFSTDASEPGSYFFKTDRVSTPVNVSRFRITDDAVVGAFPFVDPLAANTTYAVKPFIAARKLITNAAELVGTYNLFGISRRTTGDGSQITQTAMSAGGTVFKLCNSFTVYSIANCPPEMVQTFTVTPTDETGIWRMVNDADANDTSRFSVARIGNQNVYLSGGPSLTTPGRFVMRIALQDTPVWTAATGQGASTGGTWGTVDVTTASSTRNAIAADGTSSTGSNVLTEVGLKGVRSVSNAAPGAGYFAMYSNKLFVLVGSASGSTAGYLQINLLD